MEQYKEEIRSTRVGSLGSSDGALLKQIADLDAIPKSAYKRLAVCKGLLEQTEIPQTAAVRAGDELEMLVYEHLKANDERYQSNPLWVSKKYSRKSVRLISHPDLVLQDDENKVLNVYEVKCTKFNFDQTKNTYEGQLYIHYSIAQEIAKELGDYKVRLFLVHYLTDGLNLEEGLDFDPSRLTVRQMHINHNLFDLAKAMDLVDAFLQDFNEYYGDGDEIPSEYLPEKVKNEFDTITTFLAEIKEREKKVEDFKKRLYDFMVEKNVKSIKNESWSITRIDPSESVQFDSKAFLEDYTNKYPRKAKKLVKTFEKRVKRKGSVQIRIKDNNNE